jgi:GH15 family glucan-1,4-alpha-glucosidase
VVRYFGNGLESADRSGPHLPNIETDGWGLFLWAARIYLQLSGDRDWLLKKNQYNEVIYQVIRDLVAEPIVKYLEPNYIVKPEASIWERHWENRDNFFYTSAASARGLCDMAAISSMLQHESEQEKYALISNKMRHGIKESFAGPDNVFAGARKRLQQRGGDYLDGAVVEVANWDLYANDDPYVTATINALKGLKTKFGGYMRIKDSNDSYDLAEWIMIDLRLAEAFRRIGNVEEAERLLSLVTQQAQPNFDLLPELYDDFGNYKFNYPMVGYGAAAYILTLLHRAGKLEPRECSSPQEQANKNDGQGLTSDPSTFKTDAPLFRGDGGLVLQPHGSNKDRELACFCVLSARGAEGASPWNLFPLGGLLFFAIWSMTRRQRTS